MATGSKNLVLYVVTVCIYITLYLYLFREHGLSGSVAAIDWWWIGGLSLACVPFKVRGCVFTLMGNAFSDSRAYSLFSLFQRASNRVHNVVGVGYFHSDTADVLQWFGIACLRACRGVVHICGICIGIGGDYALQYFGVSYLGSAGDTGQFAGISVQVAEKQAETYFAFSPYMRVGSTIHPFPVWASLTASSKRTPP